MNTSGFVYVLTSPEAMNEDKYMVGSYSKGSYETFVCEMREEMSNLKVLFFHICDDVDKILDKIVIGYGASWSTDVNGGKYDWIRTKYLPGMISMIMYQIMIQRMDFGYSW